MNGDQQCTTQNNDYGEYYEEERSQGDVDDNDDQNVDEEDEDAPLIKPVSYEISGYGDEDDRADNSH